MRLNEAQWVWMSLIESEWGWLSLIESEWVWMSLIESDWVWMSLNESEWVWMSLNESQIRYKRLINSSSINLLHDRIRKYWREHSQKSHTNEKSHASERLWSESHFRLVLSKHLKSKSCSFWWDKWLQICPSVSW